MKDQDLQSTNPGPPEDEQGKTNENERELQPEQVAPSDDHTEMTASEDPHAPEEESALEIQPEEYIANEDTTQDEQSSDPVGVMVADQPVGQTEQAASSGGGGNKGWMITSLVLAAALIVVLIVPPFGKSSNNDAVARVNNVDITKNSLYEEMVKAGGPQTLDGLITMEVIRQAMEEQSLTVTEEDLNKEIDALKASFPSEEDFNTALGQAGMTIDDLKEQATTQIQLKKLLGDKVQPTEEEIEQTYEQNKDRYATPEQVRASHILVETKEEAEEIEMQLKEGADFAEIAAEKNEDATKDRGGDLNFFGRGEMDPAFEEAAFKLAVGEISGPVQSSFGYHIIKVTDKKEATNPTFEEKKEEIREELINQKVYEQANGFVQELKNQATITNTLED